MEEINHDEISQRISSINTQYQSYGIAGLSQAYEDFKKEVEKAEAAAYKGKAGKVVLQRIKDLENLFSTVTGNDVKELSMFMKDSEALRTTAEFASLNADHIKFGDLSDALSVDEFTKAAMVFMNPDLQMVNAAELGPRSLDTQGAVNESFHALDWKRLSDLFWLCGAVPAPMAFLNGPLATQRRRVTPRSRAVDDTVSKNKTTARKVSAEDLQDDPEQSTSHMVRLVYGVLNEQSDDERVNLYKFFINPNSFSQSVENLFYTSFLVRDGKVQLGQDEEGTPYIEVASTDEIDESAGITHQIATFTYPVWQKLIKDYQITELYIPHRCSLDEIDQEDREEEEEEEE